MKQRGGGKPSLLNITMESRSVRELTRNDIERCVPVHVVWEITLACNLKCNHCGSRAGKRREGELTSEECLDLVDQMAALGTREVSLIGGESYLRRDWTEIIGRVKARGMRSSVQTGGYQFTNARLREAASAGLDHIGVSIDGLAALHDRVRGVAGSFDQAVGLLKRSREHGIAPSVNTQIGPETAADLPGLLDVLVAAQVKIWRFQLTVAMGNAVDNDNLLLQPYQILEVMPLLARLHEEGKRKGVRVEVGNNIGFFGPYEELWRGDGRGMHWAGCSAGQNVIGIEADGTIKGCPSLATNDFAGGNIRDLTLEQIWNWNEQMHFTRTRTAEDLWGYCATCYYGDACRAGCTWTGHSLFGKTGNNPYCHHRALDLAKQGLRERVVKRREAPDASFAIGEFDLMLEAMPGHAVAAPVLVRPEKLVKITMPALPRTGGEPPSGTLVRRMRVCQECRCHIHREETACPFCGAAVLRKPKPAVNSVLAPA